MITEDEENDPRKALYLDDQRFQPLLLVFLATFINVLGDNVISTARKNDESIMTGNHFYYYFFNYFYLLAFGLMFVPATYVIEVHGIRKSVFFGSIMTTIGLWCNYLRLLTFGGVLVGIGMPFIFFTTTKLSAQWFGPKGRNITTTFIIIAYFIPQTIEEFMDEDTAKFDLELAIASTVLAPVMWFLSQTPQYSPTMGEEEKFITG